MAGADSNPCVVGGGPGESPFARGCAGLQPRATRVAIGQAVYVNTISLVSSSLETCTEYPAPLYPKRVAYTRSAVLMSSARFAAPASLLSASSSARASAVMSNWMRLLFSPTPEWNLNTWHPFQYRMASRLKCSWGWAMSRTDRPPLARSHRRKVQSSAQIIGQSPWGRREPRAKRTRWTSGCPTKP